MDGPMYAHITYQAGGMTIKLPGPLCAGGDRRSGPPSLATNMKILDVPQIGKTGTMVSYKTRYGQFRRRYVVPRDPGTPAQVNRRPGVPPAAEPVRAGKIDIDLVVFW